MSFGDLELHGHFYKFSLVWTEVVPRQVQQPITNFTGPWDDFMVHGVNNPSLLLYDGSLSCLQRHFVGWVHSPQPNLIYLYDRFLAIAR